MLITKSPIKLSKPQYTVSAVVIINKGVVYSQSLLVTYFALHKINITPTSVLRKILSGHSVKELMGETLNKPFRKKVDPYLVTYMLLISALAVIWWHVFSTCVSFC